MAHGLLNLHKPSGATSRDVVNRVQRLLPRRAKIGHAGTLDPLASGVLVACVGPATRLIPYVQRMPKSYTGTFLLGRGSPTEDVEGPVSELVDPPVPTIDAIREAARALTGPIQQRPPAYSALKLHGQRAYALARAGKDVTLAPREVVVLRIDVRAYAYPELVLDVECKAGTYIRSLGRDLAESLGTAAVMSGLVRTAIGPFTLAEAIDPDGLSRENLPERLLPPLCAVSGLARVTLSAEAAIDVRHGRTIPLPPHAPRAAEYAALDSAGRLLAILIPRGVGRLGPTCNLSADGAG
ncbi:MAG: tRNA pseudouridine(55) synthase TruB [Pirellulales bacterium]|nr:tRNA pseudouridine(55) synthase TruB [Pirellulales bacterium]